MADPVTGLKFVRSAEEHALRSVGDQPNGVVGVTYNGEEGGLIVVSAKYEPGELPEGVAAVTGVGDDDPYQVQPIPIDEAVAALADKQAAEALWSMACGALRTVVGIAIAELAWADGRAMFDFAEQLETALVERFGE